jgi:hypothetical protein
VSCRLRTTTQSKWLAITGNRLRGSIAFVEQMPNHETRGNRRATMSEASPAAGEPSSDLGRFFAKACIVAAVISFFTIFTVNWIVGSIEESIDRTMESANEKIVALNSQYKIGGSAFWTKMERELDNAAAPDADLPPEKKQRLLNDVRIITARWRPFVSTVRQEMDKPAGGD